MLFPRFSHRSLRAMVSLIWILAALFAVWVGSDLVTRFITPTPVSATAMASSDPLAAAQQIIARGALSAAANSDLAESGDAGLSAATTRFRLIGIATGFENSPGFALLQQGEDTVLSAQVGDTLSPGITLVSLHAEYIEINSGGQIKSLPLERMPARPPLPPSPEPAQHY